MVIIKEISLLNFVPRLEGETTFPLGPLYITSMLEQLDCEVDFRDYQLATYKDPLSQESILNFLSGSKKTLGISCFFNTLPFILPCLQKIKAENPEKRIILGGPGPTSVAERIMRRFFFIDNVVVGEGEHTMLDMAKGLPNSDIRGIVYRSNGKVLVNPPRERIRKLDSLPFPAYHKVEFSNYNNAGIITTRGCPYRCSFCEAAPLWGYSTKQRSVSNVISEIRILYDHYGVRTLHINDDTFVLNRSWVLDFCSALKAEKIDITWRCLGRINLMDEELISKMADAGCVGIQYGIESGSEHVLKLIAKQISKSKVKNIIKMSVNHIKSVISTFMWGFPYESMEDFFETIYLMGEVAELGSLIKLLLLSPSPLSPLYREYSHQLKFSEKLVSNLLWGVLKNTVSPEEKEHALRMIVQNQDIFPGFFYIYSPDINKKYSVLKKARIIC